MARGEATELPPLRFEVLPSPLLPEASPEMTVKVYEGTRATFTLTSSQQELLKWFALISMVLDHANRILWGFEPWLYAVGRLAFPLFCFLIAYNTIKRGVSTRRYLFPLFVFGLISQAPYVYALEQDWWCLNIFFTLLLGVTLRPLAASLTARVPQAFAPAVWVLLATVVIYLAQPLDYGGVGVLLIPTMQGVLRQPRLTNLSLLLFVLLLVNRLSLYSLSPLLLVPLLFLLPHLPLPPLPRSRWLMYVIYPVHLLLLKLFF